MSQKLMDRMAQLQQTLFSTLLLFALILGGLVLDRKSLITGNHQSATIPAALCSTSEATDAQIAASRGISLEMLRHLHTSRGLTSPEICRMPEARLARAISKVQHPKPDHPGEAAAFRQTQLEDENGQIPADGFQRASEQVERMRAVSRSKSPSGAGLDSLSWTWIGPGNIGGRVRSIVIHPTQPNLMWAGSVSGGIWKSEDGGNSWQPVDDFMANLAVSTLVMHPSNHNILYAGTGEGFYNTDGIRGAGVFKTTDGGATWEQLATTANPEWFYVNRLAIDPNNGEILLAATRTGLYRTLDGGANWSRVLTADILDVDYHPGSSSDAIASGYSSIDFSGAAWYTTNGGLDWSPAKNLPGSAGRIEIAYAPSSPNQVYASIERNSGELWKSTDGGQNYIRVNNTTNYLGSQGWYGNILWIDPTNNKTLVVGGIDLYRSTNGGSSFTKISEWWNSPPSAHADHHTIVAHPNFDGVNNKTVYFGNDGGIYKTQNIDTVTGTDGWEELNNSLGITQFYSAAGNPSTGVIVGGTQDNGTLYYSGGTETWGTVFGGDGGFSAADPTDPNYFYGEYVYLQIHRSQDGGASADYICGKYWNGFQYVWKPAPYSIPDAKNSAASFIAPFILDSNDPNRILAGGISLWRTNDAKTPNTFLRGPSWFSIKQPTSVSNPSPITAIAIAPGNPDLIWVGHKNGDVYQIANGTSMAPTWTRMDTQTPGLPNRYVTRITIDPDDHARVYITFGGFAADNIWRTRNGGSSWSKITGRGLSALPTAPVRSLLVHPDHPDWLYAGSEVGVFTSEDGGASWFLPQDGPANVSVDELFWLDKKLVAVTHGRGLYQATPVAGWAGFVAFPASGLAPLNVTFTNTSASSYTSSFWDFGDGITSTLSSPVHTYQAAGAYTITLTVSGPGWTNTSMKTNYVNVYQPVSADFNASMQSGYAPLTVTLINTSSGDYDTSLWDFGDGITSTLQSNLIHTFMEAGVYTVTLTVSGPGGINSRVKTSYITTHTPPPDGDKVYLPLMIR